MKNKNKIITLGTGQQSNGKIVETEAQSTPTTHKYMTPLIFLAWYRHFNKK